jgi:cleavage and polyadenylation specificity factor subunit 3
MMRLKSKLLSLNASKTSKVKVYSPRNCEELRIPFKSDKTAKGVGKLASIPPPMPLMASSEDAESAPSSQLHGQPHMVTGVLVQNDFKLSLMAPEDLREYAGLNTTTVTCKQRLRLSAAGIDLIKWALEGTFGAVEELPEMRQHLTTSKDVDMENNGDKKEAADEEVSSLVAAYLVMGCVAVRYRSDGEVELEWEGNMLNDGIADSVMAVLFSVESSPAAVKQSSSKHPHSHSQDLPAEVNPHARPSPADRLERMLWFLEAQFGADNVAPVENPKLPSLPTPALSTSAEAGDDDGDEVKKEEDEDGLQARRDEEIRRLHKIGIPVPGVCITVDKMVATVWLEDLGVECNNKVFADRVRAVVERAVEITAPLWG